MEEVAKQPVLSGENGRFGVAGSGPQQLHRSEALGPAGRRWGWEAGELRGGDGGARRTLPLGSSTRAKALCGPVWPSMSAVCCPTPGSL